MGGMCIIEILSPILSSKIKIQNSDFFFSKTMIKFIVVVFNAYIFL